MNITALRYIKKAALWAEISHAQNKSDCGERSRSNEQTYSTKLLIFILIKKSLDSHWNKYVHQYGFSDYITRTHITHQRAVTLNGAFFVEIYGTYLINATPVPLKNFEERGGTDMRFKWTSITESEFERLVERCNFTPVELQILELRRKGKTPLEVAIEINYSERQIYNLSKDVVVKIRKEL